MSVMGRVVCMNDGLKNGITFTITILRSSSGFASSWMPDQRKQTMAMAMAMRARYQRYQRSS